MRSIEITAVSGRQVKCIEPTRCSIAVQGDPCDRPAELAFDLGGRVAPACHLHIAAGLDRGGVALAGGRR